MLKVFKLMKLAKQYKELWIEWNKHTKEENAIFEKIEDKEHEILELIIK